jgi:hypothetical protein
LSEAPWSQNSCHNTYSAWASAKWAGGSSTRSRSCSGRTAMPSEAGRAARDDEASTPCAGRPGITQPPSLITSTPTGARGLVRAGSPTGPIRAAGCRRSGPPPPPPGRR